MKDNFNQRKNSVLSKKDKSFKKNMDGKISGLCEKINSLENYYTTSSCSGRIVMIIDEDKKENGLFLKTHHDLISFEELKNELEEIINEFSGAIKQRAQRGKTIKFKQEQVILHVACRTIEDAFGILKKAGLAGFKRSGIISAENRIVVEIMSTEKLEFPIINNKKLLVSDYFLRLIVKKSNENLKKGWKKINELEKLVN